MGLFFRSVFPCSTTRTWNTGQDILIGDYAVTDSGGTPDASGQDEESRDHMVYVVCGSLGKEQNYIEKI